jgi:8-oxo-dGTP pyrophosphatase MutT (NUDIX family)
MLRTEASRQLLWWKTSKERQSLKLLTLVIMKKDDKVFLDMKKLGFLAGYFNGFKGKVEAIETIYEAVVRELEEECGVVFISMEKWGILMFNFGDKSTALKSACILCR